MHRQIDSAAVAISYVLREAAREGDAVGSPLSSCGSVT
jgi:hypothetical protein